MVGEQSDAMEVQVGKDLGAYADIPLGLPLMIRMCGLAHVTVEGEDVPFPNLVHSKSFSRLMQIDQCATSCLSDHLQGPGDGRMAVTPRSTKDVTDKTVRMYADQ